MKIFVFLLCLYYVSTSLLALAATRVKSGHGKAQNFAFKLDEEAGILKKRSTSVCNVTTTDGACCVFPFIYNGKSYQSCTTVDNGGVLWCSKTSNYDTDEQWGYCKIPVCNVTTTDGACCVFPFIYNGKSYQPCTTVDNGGVLWCSKTSNYDADKQWGNCNIPVNPCDSSPCDNGGTCKKNENSFICTCADGFEGETCKEKVCNVTTTDGACCVFPFIYNGKSYQSCTTVDNGGVLWCSKTSNYDADKQWGNCNIPVNPCDSSPCDNGGTCKKNENSFICTCADGFEGETCKEKESKLSFVLCSSKIEKQGCFESRVHHGHLLANHRNEIKWTGGWNDYLKKAICDCSTLAKDGNYKYFYIEFYGECWGDNIGPAALALTENPNECWGEGKTAGFVCKDNGSSNSPLLCVGKERTGYFYKLVE